MENGRTVLKWNHPFKTALRDRFPEHYAIFQAHGNPADRPMMRIERQDTDNRHLLVTLRDADLSGDVPDFELLDSPESDDDSPEVREGKRRWRTHLSIERNTSIIRQAKSRALRLHGTLACEVCQCDFSERYGERGHGFIEAHHKLPLHELGENGGITRIEDIALICSNCHRMIHVRQPWLTIEELKAIHRHDH